MPARSTAQHGRRFPAVSIRRWVAIHGSRIAAELRRREAKPGRVWHLDEMVVRIGGKQHRHLLRASEYRSILRERFAT